MLELRNFIDTHVHLWDLNNEYPWIQNNTNKDLKQNYLIQDLMKDANNLPLKKIVHVQAEINEKNKIMETEWLQNLSDLHPLGFPNAIVGFVNLLDPLAEKDIEAHQRFKNFRGIRQILKSKDPILKKKNVLAEKKTSDKTSSTNLNNENKKILKELLSDLRNIKNSF